MVVLWAITVHTTAVILTLVWYPLGLGRPGSGHNPDSETPPGYVPGPEMDKLAQVENE